MGDECTTSRDKKNLYGNLQGIAVNKNKVLNKSEEVFGQTVHRVQDLDLSCWRRKSPSRTGNRAGGRNKGKQNRQPVAPPVPRKEKELPEKITFYESLTVAELAKKLGREPSEIIKKLFLLGVMATINQELDKDAIELICTDYGVEVEEEIRVDISDLEGYFEGNRRTRCSNRTSTGCYNYGTR